MLNHANMPLLDARYFSHLTAFLRLKGWAEHLSTFWYEFFGPADADGNPLLLVLPRNQNSPDTQSYINKALDLLSALYDESEQIVAQRVQYYHSDVFITRNLETGLYSSIPLKLASTQVSELKQLVVYAARTEREPRPYFRNYSSVGQRMTEQFRFGHTIRGSFGLTVEAPIVHDMELYTPEEPEEQPPLLLDLADFIVETQITVPPIERRIVERLVRGLMITREAAQEKSIRPIVNGYGSGFNGNMCAAVVKLGHGEGPIEYRVLWSPKIEVAEDMSETPSVRLNDADYLMLDEAQQEMRQLQPEYKRIRGIVTHIGSNIPPLSEDDEGRQVMLRWIRDDSSRTVNVIVPLNKGQYLLAHQAHLKWATVAVTGVVEKVGNSYRLLDATDFEILNP